MDFSHPTSEICVVKRNGKWHRGLVRSLLERFDGINGVLGGWFKNTWKWKNKVYESFQEDQRKIQRLIPARCVHHWLFPGEGCIPLGSKIFIHHYFFFYFSESSWELYYAKPRICERSWNLFLILLLALGRFLCFLYLQILLPPIPMLNIFYPLNTLKTLMWYVIVSCFDF